MNQPASAYFLEERHDPNETHTLSVLVQNEPGVLARVIGLFSGRGYNIESLTVSETESQKHLSRITIVTTGTPMVIEQIKHQLDRMKGSRVQAIIRELRGESIDIIEWNEDPAIFAANRRARLLSLHVRARAG